MKIKANMKIPRSDSFKGLSVENWEKLNLGEEIELEKIPDALQPYLDSKKKKKDK